MKKASCYWTEEEEARLIKWLHHKPLKLICNEWNQWAKQNNCKERPDHQIRDKVSRLKSDPRLKDCVFIGRTGVPRIRPIKNNWSCQDLKRILKTPRFERILRWVHKKGLPYQDIGGSGKSGYFVIKKADLEYFAVRHPEEFWGIERQNLAKVMRPDLATKIFTINRERQPTNGRSLPIVRLDKEEYYSSATAAATALNLNTSSVCKCAIADLPLKTGHDFFRYDYPQYWVPSDVREEFNSIASALIYKFYLELKNLSGFSKQSCLFVAARNAVSITLYYFRSLETAKAYDLTIKPQQVFMDCLVEKTLARIKEKINVNSRQFLTKIASTIRYRYFNSFLALVKSESLANQYCQDFAAYYLEQSTRYFYKNSFIPNDYQPKDRLQAADFFVAITRGLNSVVCVGKRENLKMMKLLYIHFLNFLKKHKLIGEIKEQYFIEGYAPHETREIISCQSEETLNDSRNYLSELLTIANQKYSKDKVQKLELFVALKLEDASDNEVAECLGVSFSEVDTYYRDLHQLTLPIATLPPCVGR
jgi:hypothetical protein